MELKGERWENYSTAEVDHDKKSEHLVQKGFGKLKTSSLSELRDAIESAIEHYKRNGVNPDEVPVFVEFDRVNYTCQNFAYCTPATFLIRTNQFSKLVYTAPDSRPEVGEYWKSRGASDWDCSGFVVSKLAGERLLRLVKYVLEWDEPKSWLDFRESEPNWIQFKFDATEFDVVLLDKLSKEAGGVITEEILRKCVK